MAIDPDLHHAISMRPQPFHQHPHPVPGRAESPASPTRPHSQTHPTVLHSSDGKSAAVASTTAYESAEHDPVSRPGRAASDAADVENQRLPSYTPETDPYHLSGSLKSPEELEAIRANSSRKRDSAGTTRNIITVGKDAWKAKKLHGFYEAQNETIEQLLKPVDDHVRDAKEEAGADKLKYQIAVQGSFAANVCLAALQLYGAISSGSLSLFTTCADALFDPLSNITLILCNRAVNRVDGRKYPSGKARIETAGNICFCFLMCSVSFILIVLSARDIAAGSNTETNTFHFPSVIAVAVAFATKFALFLYCWALRNKYSQIRILWEDHRNDLFINGFGILTSVGGSKLIWWLDPMGSIILSVLIATLWLRTAYSEFQLLIGVTADTQTLQLITYISMTHSPHIISLDTVRAWHSGPRIVVEVDIVLSPERSLRDTHDIAEELQTKLESLPIVERAYVHVDYETSHAPEHFLKKQL